MTKHQTKGTRTKGIGDHAMENAMQYHMRAHIYHQLAMSWQVKKYAVTTCVSKLPQHLLHVHCFESTNFSTQCFWHATWIASILAPSAFGLPPIAFHTCKPCMLHGHVGCSIALSAFGMTYSCFPFAFVHQLVFQ